MSLEAGQQLAHYEILKLIGKGGMGEVYRARDGKLGRDVAIKVLPDAFAENEERLARFKREAKVLASLNHPGIAAIHGLEESEGTHYLVLELVPGETLAERIARGPISVEEARQIAMQVAEAMEAAHERGIVHRDLKPANIKLTPDDIIKILDFGLAKAFVAETPEADSSMSPTLTRDATRVGVIMGTAAYMSPEQAKGKKVDQHTDIFAFGAVLFEMLTGRKAFVGEDVSEVLAAVIKSEPDWSALGGDVPPAWREILRRCLEKNPSRRLRAIADTSIFLENGASFAAEVAPAESQWSWRHVIGVGAAGAVVGALVSSLLVQRDTTAPSVQHLSVTLPPDLSLQVPGNLDIGPSVALSPDGTMIVFVEGGLGDTSLYLRRLNSAEVVPLTGTEGGFQPFFSPDGEWIAFFANDQMKKHSLKIGNTAAICEVQASPMGAVWLESNEVVFDTFRSEPLRVSASGGEPTLIAIESAETGRQYSRAVRLPIPGKILSSSRSSGGEFRVEVVDLDSGETHPLVDDARAVGYAASGYLIFARAATLFAVPFDLERLRVTQEIPVPILDNVEAGPFGAYQISLSDNGTLAYVPRGLSQPAGELVRVSRNGEWSALPISGFSYTRPRMSPDGRHLAVGEATALGRASQVVVIDLTRGTRTRLTFEDRGVATGSHVVSRRQANLLQFGQGNDQSFFRCT